MIICNDCGHVFDESEWGDYGECPSCNSTDTGEALECPICGEYHNGMLEGHSIYDCCPDCFQKALNRDNFRKYATSRYDDYTTPDIMEDFIMYELFDIDEDFRFSSIEFKEHCLKLFDDLAKPDRYGVCAVDDMIKDYFDRVPDCYYDFAQWLAEEHEKEKKK